MGWSFRHPGFGLVCRLDEHGGDAEERDEALYLELNARITAAIAAIVTEPRYAPIVVEYSQPEGP